MKLEDIIKQLAIDKHGSLRAFCDKEHLEYQTINKSLTRSVLRSSFQNTMKLCRALELDPYDLAEGVARKVKNSALTGEDRRVLDALRKASDREKEIAGFVLRLPGAGEEQRTLAVRLYDMAVSAGPGNELTEDSSEQIDIVYRAALRNADFCLTVKGDSMEPRFSGGDIVAVQETPGLDYGEIGVFVLNGEGYIKVYDPEGLVSLNPKYDVIKPREGDDFRTVGRVLGKAEPVR
ncbi:MAG: LexA family transcriptional regulator [Abditibacteriota bacterium]|nr:LexA family transcriptional regulator [Abditibacteriota bacterium]